MEGKYALLMEHVDGTEFVEVIMFSPLKMTTKRYLPRLVGWGMVYVWTVGIMGEDPRQSREEEDSPRLNEKTI